MKLVYKYLFPQFFLHKNVKLPLMGRGTKFRTEREKQDDLELRLSLLEVMLVSSSSLKMTCLL